MQDREQADKTIEVDLGPVEQFPPGQARLVETAHDPVLVWAESPERIHAYVAICPHMGNHLQAEDCHGHVVTCQLHQWEFDLGTGRNVDGLPMPLRRVHTEIRDAHLIARFTKPQFPTGPDDLLV
jgi:nitrite reductase/ring-hydroxylating ferredoxin subunit